MRYYYLAHKRCADVAELADALDSGSSGHYARAGSSPVIRSNAESGNIERCYRFLYYPEHSLPIPKIDRI